MPLTDDISKEGCFYTLSDLDAAVRLYKGGGISLRSLSSEINIPQSTICDRLSGKNSKDYLGKKTPTSLRFEIEEYLAAITNLKDRKIWLVERKELVDVVKTYLDLTGEPNFFINNTPGRKWLELFGKRWINGVDTSAQDSSTCPNVQFRSKILSVGDKFATYQELEDRMTEFEKEQNCTYVAKWKIPLEKSTYKPPYALNNENIKYFHVQYACIERDLGGFAASKLKHNVRYRSGCKSYVEVRATRDARFLKIQSLNVSHTHSNSSVLRSLPKSRKLNLKELKEVLLLFKRNLEIRQVQEHITSNYNKNLTVADITDLQARFLMKTSATFQDPHVSQGLVSASSTSVTEHCYSNGLLQSQKQTANMASPQLQKQATNMKSSQSQKPASNKTSSQSQKPATNKTSSQSQKPATNKTSSQSQKPATNKTSSQTQKPATNMTSSQCQQQASNISSLQSQKQSNETTSIQFPPGLFLVPISNNCRILKTTTPSQSQLNVEMTSRQEQRSKLASRQELSSRMTSSESQVHRIEMTSSQILSGGVTSSQSQNRNSEMTSSQSEQYREALFVCERLAFAMSKAPIDKFLQYKRLLQQLRLIWDEGSEEESEKRNSEPNQNNSKKQPDSEVGVSAKNSVQPDSFHGHNNSDSLEAPAESTLPSKTADPFPEIIPMQRSRKRRKASKAPANEALGVPPKRLFFVEATKPVMFSKKTTLGKTKCMLKWFVNPAAAESAFSGYQIQLNDVKQLHNISHAFRNESAPVAYIRKYFTRESWKHLQVLMKEMRFQPLPCKICQLEVSGKHIRCDGCLEFFHMLCAGFRKSSIVKEWFCKSCYADVN